MMTLEYLFYWYYVLLTATVGGKVYATGDWRLPQSTDDFGNRIETRWVIAGTEDRSSCYVWVQPENGYHFAGIVDENNQQVCSAEKLSEIRLWCKTNSVQEEDGIVSGNDFYPAKPQTFTAVFLPDSLAGIASTSMMGDCPKDVKFDLSGRKVTTPRGGQIVVWNKKKVLVK